MHKVHIVLKRLGNCQVGMEKSELDRLLWDWKINQTKATCYKGVLWMEPDEIDKSTICSPVLCPSQIASITVDGVSVPRLTE